MANQAIALQARVPQNDFMGRAIQQNAQVMNMMTQQRAAERQAAQAQQALEIARAGEARAAAKEGREISQFEIEQAARQFDYHTRRSSAVMTPQGYEKWLAAVDRDSPEMGEFFRTNLPPERFDRDVFTRMVGGVNEVFGATFGSKKSEVQIGVDGTPLEVRTGGFGKPGAYEIPLYELAPSSGSPPAGAPAQTPRAPAPATDAQIDEAARAIIGGAGIQDGPLRGLSPEDFDRATERANQMTAGGGARMQPVSMTTGAQMGGQPDMTAIVQDMMSSKQISQSNLQLMREMAGPDKDQQLAQILRANNIQIVPDEQPGMRSAEFRPGQDAAPQMQQVQEMEGYRPTGRAARVKDPMQSPMPGSAQVPLPRVRAEAEAKRETPQEAAAKAAAVARANAAAAAEAKREEKMPGRRNVSLIVGKMRAAYEMLDRMEAIPSEKRGAGANFLDYLGATSGGREFQKMIGKDASKYFSQIQALRKQLATAIKNATGMSAQEMNSNVELQLTLDAMSDPTQGFEAAMQIMQDIEELYGARAAAPAKQPTGGGGVDMNNPLLRGM